MTERARRLLLRDVDGDLVDPPRTVHFALLVQLLVMIPKIPPISSKANDTMTSRSP
jgi:hypothetical protein